jgi:hypothetical protein
MGRNHLCEQAIPKDPAHLLQRTCVPRRPSGLSFGFPKLSPSRRQLDYVLLARPPRYSPCGFHVRLACLIHAANVRSEPGSNPSLGSSVLGVAPIGSRDPSGWLRWLGRFQPANAQFLRSHASLSRPPGMSKIASLRPLPACEGREKVATDRKSSSTRTSFLACS